MRREQVSEDHRPSTSSQPMFPYFFDSERSSRSSYAGSTLSMGEVEEEPYDPNIFQGEKKRVNAIEYIKETFIIRDIEKLLETDRKEALFRIHRNFIATLPYHNIRVLSMDVDKRAVLSRDEIFRDCLNRFGGTCYVLNVFMNEMLAALDFDVVLNAGRMATSIEESKITLTYHVFNLVRNVMVSGDLYLLDPGSWFPTFKPVPLHTLAVGDELVYKDLFHTYKYVNEGDRFTRYHLKRSPFGDERWRPFYIVPRDTMPRAEITKCIDNSYRQGTSGLFAYLIFSLYPIGMGITLTGQTLRTYEEERGKFLLTKLRTPEQIFDRLSKYVHLLRREMIYKAYDCYLWSPMRRQSVDVDVKEN